MDKIKKNTVSISTHDTGGELFLNTHQVRTVLLGNNVFFCVNDFKPILLISNGTSLRQRIEKDNCLYLKDRRVGQRGGWFTNTDGVLCLIERAYNVSKSYKQNILQQLRYSGIKTKKYVYGRKESSFLDRLEEYLQVFNITGIRQFRCGIYNIDFYIPTLNLAIEYDEKGHKHYNKKNEETRTKKIYSEILCTFFRVTDNNSDLYNIGLFSQFVFRNFTNKMLMK